jgi:hypothetical protein
MTKRRLPYDDLEHFTTEIIDVYKKARAVYDECDDDQTIALHAGAREAFLRFGWQL